MPVRMVVPSSFLLFCTLSFAAMLSSPVGAQMAADAEYRVQFREASLLHPTVTANIRIANGKLITGSGGGIDHVDGGWASFVDDLRLTTPDGRVLDVKSHGKEGWSVADYEGRARMTYRVRLDFAMEPWPPGNEQAGLYREDSLFVVSKPLFVVPADAESVTVRFDIPTGWNVATPWKPVAENLLQLGGVEELTDNSIVVSKERAMEFQHGAVTLLLSTVGLDSSSRLLLEETLRAAMDRVRELFPDASEARYLMTLLYGGMDDGESFERSAAFTTATIPRAENRMLWGNNLAHELLHIWIGGQLRGDDGSFEWFDEGFTDYYADSALRRAGLIDAQQLLTKMEKVMGRYGYYVWSSLFPTQSMAEASLNKGRFRFGIYDGGWATAFCLDVRIRENAPGRSLDDVMGLLYTRFGRTDTTFDRSTFRAAITEVAGTDLSGFMARHVYGSDPLPLEDCLQGAGLEGAFQQYAAELWISPALQPSATQVRIRDELLGERDGLGSPRSIAETERPPAPIVRAGVNQQAPSTSFDARKRAAVLLESSIFSQSRSDAAPEALEQFGQLVGTWDIEQERMADDGSWLPELQKALWIWTYALGGYAIQDFWIEPPADGNGSAGSSQWGTNLRVYDSSSASWHVVWTSNQDSGFTSYRARQVGDEVIMTGTHPGTERVSRIVYGEFTPTSFAWRLDFQNQDGSWRTVARIRATRRDSR